MAFINGEKVLFSAQIHTTAIVDDELNANSENPVQNKAIVEEFQKVYDAIDEIENVGITVDAELSATSENPVQNKAIYAELAETGQTMSLIQTGIAELSKKVMPTVTAADNGKVLMVVDGEWEAVTIPAAEAETF